MGEVPPQFEIPDRINFEALLTLRSPRRGELTLQLVSLEFFSFKNKLLAGVLENSSSSKIHQIHRKTNSVFAKFADCWAVTILKRTAPQMCFSEKKSLQFFTEHP